MHKINKYYALYNDGKKYKRVNGIYVGNNLIASNNSARCYVIPCKQNSTYRIKRNKVTNRSLIAVTREYPKANSDIVVSNYNMSTNLSVDISTRDGNYIVIYYAIGTSASDSIRWNIKKLSNTINIFRGFELGDYDSQTGNAKDNDKRIRSVSEEKVLIDSGTYTIDFNANLTIGIRLYDINENFYTFAYQNNGSGKLTFDVTKQSYIKLIAETTITNRKAILMKEV